jgi:UDP-N-acetylmuramyl pentapeptide synthase
MKTLRSILPSNVASTTGVLDIEISGIAFDSRKVSKGDLFVALPGQHIDGSAFIFDALERGAAAVLTEGHARTLKSRWSRVTMPDRHFQRYQPVFMISHRKK